MTLLNTIKTGQPAQNAFHSAGIRYLEDLTQFTEKELLSLHGIGPKVIRILKAELLKINLSFKKI